MSWSLAAHVPAASSGLLLQTDPLHRACKAGKWSEVKALIDSCGQTRQARSFYVNRRDANGSSPIFHCVWYGFYRVLALLLYHGANPNLQNNRRNTSEHTTHHTVAAAQPKGGGSSEHVRARPSLIIVCLCLFVCSALHLVSEQMHWSCAGLLLQAGARCDIVNGEGKTCLQVIPYGSERDAYEFANYLQQQQWGYACENSYKADLFEFALPAPPPLALPASIAGAAATPAAKPGAGPASAAAVAVASAKRLEHESIRRLCWAIEHLHREAAPFSGTSRPADGASAPAQTEALDPDLLAPIQALEWSFGGGGGGGSLGVPSSVGASPASAAFGGSPFSPPTAALPHHSRHYSTASTFSASSQHSAAASAMPTLSAEAKAQLKSALLSLHQLAMRFPPSPLGPGLESRHRGAEHDPAVDPSEPYGPRLSWHGLGHFVNHLATHWPGLPLSYKKFCLSYLIRFASNPANAAAMVGSTRSVDLCWANDRPASQSVLVRLVDAVLDWVEIQRGLSCFEPECSLLPPSKTFCSVATALGSLFPAQANPLTNPHNAGTAALAAALAASHTASHRSHRRSPSALSSAAAALGSTFGAAFSGSMLSPTGSSVAGSSPAAGGGSASHLGAPSSAQAPGTPQAQPNPFVPAFSYVDDYEVASLLLELVASVLCTLRTHSEQLRPDMAAGPASEAAHAAAVAAEECAPNGLPKLYVTGGGGGCGQLAAIVHPSVAACGHADKEGVFDEAIAAAMQEHESNMEARIARRATVNAGPATSAFETRGIDVVAGNLTAPDDPVAGGSPRGAVAVHKDLVRLWRNVVRLFEEGSSSSLLRLGSIVIRAPFPCMVHPLLSLRTVFLWREGFAAMASWHPRVCDAFRTQEVIGHTLRCTKNVQHFLRPLRMDPAMLGVVAKQDPQAWKRTFNADLAHAFGIDEPEEASNLAIQISSEEETKPTAAIFVTAPAAAASTTPGRPSQLQIGSTAREDESPIKVLPVDQETPTKLSAAPSKVVESASSKLLHLTSPARSLPLATAEEKDSEAAAAGSNTTPRAQKWVASAAGSSVVPALPLSYVSPAGSDEYHSSTESPETRVSVPFKQQPPAPSQGPDTTRELQLVLGMRGADRMGAAGAQAMVSKLTAHDDAHPPPPPPPKGPKQPYMPALRTTLPDHPPADFPQSPRHSLRTSASQTALELASPLIQGAAKSIGVVAAPVKSSRGKMAHTLLPVIPRFRRSVGSKLRDVTTSQMGRVKLSMKETVIVELAKERVAAERAEAIRRQREEDSVVRIADPSKQIMALAQAGSFGMIDSAEQAPQQLAAQTAGPQNSTSLLATALPDFYSAFTIAARMMLVDRCAEFLLLLILDSAKRAQALVMRKRAAQRLKAQREAEDQKRKDDAAALRGDVDLIPLGPPAPPKRAEEVEITHDSTGHRTLKGVNDAYGPPPLTTLAADLMNFGVLDHLLMMLSERNQSLSMHRSRHAGSAPTNSEGVRLIYPEDENISVHAGLQCLAYLLRMDSTVEMMMHSAHALVVVEHLAATTEEATASSCLYILSHLLRKRDWNKRLLALKGLNPHAFKTETEMNDEEDAADESLAANRRASDAARRDHEMGLGSSSNASGGGGGSDSDSLKLFVPLEFLLMKWARVAVQLALQCLPLKPWSTLPRSLLLRNIPSRPSEAPMKLLVYQPLSDAQIKEVDRQRAQDEAMVRYKDNVARLLKAEEELEAQEMADRTFLTSMGYSADLVAARPKLNVPPPPPPSTSLALMSAEQLRELGLSPVTARDALESSAIPSAQSWFAQHYTPPSLEQRQYVEALAKAQERKIKAKAQGVGHQRNQLSISDAQTHATLAAAGMAPPFTPIAAFDGSARMEAHAESLYRSSGVHRIGGQANSTRLSPSVDSADPNALVVAAILSGASTPANKARTLYAINTAAATAASPLRTPVELEASYRTDQVLSPTSRSLQRRIDALSARSSAQSSPMSKQHSRRLADSVVPVLALDGILLNAGGSEGARAVKFDFQGGAEATSARLLKDSAASSMRTTRSSLAGSPSLHAEHPPSSDDDDDDALGSDGMLQEDPTVRAMHLAAKASARAERKAARTRTEEARQKIRNTSSPPTRRSHRSTPVDAPFSPASAAAQSTAAANTSQSTSVIGGSTPAPSWANIALSESLLYRILHCFLGFARREDDARKVLHSGALELLVGLVNHPVWDISYHALQVLTMLSTRFSEEYLVAFMEVLTRKHLSPGWLGVSLEPEGRVAANVGRSQMQDPLGFPWPTLESLVCSCADFLRVDVTFRPGKTGQSESKEPSNTARRFPVGADASAMLSPPVAAPPTRDLRSALSFQLLLNLCQDPKGRGYAMVQRQCLWYENLLADVLSHPSLKDLEERQKRFQKISHHFGSTVAGASSAAGGAAGSPFYRFPMQQTFGEEDASMAKMQRASEKQLGHQRRALVMGSPSHSSSASLGRPATPSSPARSTSPHSPRRQQSSNQVLLAAQRSKSSALLHAAAVGRPRTPGSAGGRPGTALSPHRRSATQPVSLAASSPSGFVSGGKTATGPDSSLVAATRLLVLSPEDQALQSPVVPVRPFGSWGPTGGQVFDRYFPGGVGFPAYASGSGAGAVGGGSEPSPASKAGLDFELDPSAAVAGSTELMELLADSQLSTQPVGLRVCGLASCSGVEHVAGTFLLCPRCRLSSYCCDEHRRLAWRSWHERVCCVTKRPVMKSNQTVRYPVKAQRRLHSGIPRGLRLELLGERKEEQPITRIV